MHTVRAHIYDASYMHLGSRNVQRMDYYGNSPFVVFLLLCTVRCIHTSSPH
jgi:hypothetical protein